MILIHLVTDQKESNKTYKWTKKHWIQVKLTFSIIRTGWKLSKKSAFPIWWIWLSLQNDQTLTPVFLCSSDIIEASQFRTAIKKWEMHLAGIQTLFNSWSSSLGVQKFSLRFNRNFKVSLFIVWITQLLD